MRTNFSPVISVCCLLYAFSAISFAQEQGQGSVPGVIQTTASTVPRLVSFSGVLKDAAGKPVTGPVSVTFSLYAEQDGGSPLWSETQVAEADAQGSYTVHLGATNPAGLPLELFTTGAARWLAIQTPDQAESRRVLLVGVPYALKAADADTLGGKPASAYVTLEQQAASAASGTETQAVNQANPTGMMRALAPAGNAPTACSAVTSDGTAMVNRIALFTTPCNIEQSPLLAVGGKVGLALATPFAYLDVAPTTTATSSSPTVTGQALRGSITVNPSSASSGIYEGVRGQALDTGATNAVGQLKGFTSYTESVSDQNVGVLYGSYSQSQVSKTGGYAVEAYGTYASAVETAGHLTTGYGLFAQAEGAMTTGFGVYSSVGAYGSGKPATGYGVYVAPLSVTGTSFGLYQGGANDKNYFAGNVGVGTTTPSALLEVNGTAKFDGAVTFAGGETDTGNITTAGQLVSTVATGTAPLQVSSTTQVANLNASLLDGLSASAFATTGANTFTGNQTINASLSLTGSINSALTLQGSVTDPNSGYTSSNVIAGYIGNAVTNNATGATIAGGGGSPGQGFASNIVSDDFGTVGGGVINVAGKGNGTGFAATVGGGYLNTASGMEATVGGGHANTASSVDSTVAGGESNIASGALTTVAGGNFNTASGADSTIAGGEDNTASGTFAMVAGGVENTASGDGSFAAGQYAYATDSGSFVWCQQNGSQCTSSGTNSFVVSVNGPIYFYDGTGGAGCYLSANSGSWTCSSDRNLKSNIVSIDSRSVLKRVAQMPISQWSMKADSGGHKHIGPMAQDFYSAFGLGDTDKYIAQGDAQGVALASIQGLYQEVQEKEERIRKLEAKLQDLEERMAAFSTGNPQKLP